MARVPAALIDKLGVIGSPEECREKLQKYREAGITLPIVSPRVFRAGRQGTGNGHHPRLCAQVAAGPPGSLGRGAAVDDQLRTGDER